MTAPKIATIRGIPIRIHITFLLVLPFFAFWFGARFQMAAEQAGVPPSGVAATPWLWGLGLAIALFASVLVHELAHALIAVKRGGRVHDITLLMIGGVSRLDEAPRRPRHEAWMALAGPLTSAVIGAGALLVHAALAGADSFNLRFAFFYLGSLNIFLALFNLLPAFPMDGGRIVRALLTPRMGRIRATRAAGMLGKGFAVVFALLGLLSFNFLLVIIAFFIYLGADSETRGVLVEAALGGVHVRDLMSPPPVPIRGDAPITQAVERMKRERTLELPVVDDVGKVMGVVTLGSIRHVLPQQRAEMQVAQVTQPVQPVTPEDDVWPAVRSMYAQRVALLPVVEEGRLAGVLRHGEVTRALELREFGAEEAPIRRTREQELPG